MNKSIWKKIELVSQRKEDDTKTKNLKEKYNLIMNKLANKKPSFWLELWLTERWPKDVWAYIPSWSILLEARPDGNSSSASFKEWFEIHIPAIVTADLWKWYLKFLYHNTVHKICPEHVERSFNKRAKTVNVIGHPLMVWDILKHADNIVTQWWDKDKIYTACRVWRPDKSKPLAPTMEFENMIDRIFLNFPWLK
jgi:hypothetical protein